MNVSLTRELEHLVNQKVKSGMYQTSSEVIREGLRLLKERDERMAALRRDVRAGFDEIDTGAFLEHKAAAIPKLAARVKASGRLRLKRAEIKSGIR